MKRFASTILMIGVLACACQADKVMVDPLPGIHAALNFGMFAEAFQKLQALHKAGNVEAARLLGCMYMRGDGVAKNVETGRSLLRHASTNGNIKATFQLANSYRNDDPERYSVLQRQAAERGHLTAAQQIALAYLHGEGVPRDPVQAYMWFFTIQLRSPVAAETWMEPLAELERTLLPHELEEGRIRAWNFVYIDTKSGFYQEKFERLNPGFNGPITKDNYAIRDAQLYVTDGDQSATNGREGTVEPATLDDVRP